MRVCNVQLSQRKYIKEKSNAQYVQSRRISSKYRFGGLLRTAYFDTNY